jgi:hypothetical protein
VWNNNNSLTGASCMWGGGRSCRSSIGSGSAAVRGQPPSVLSRLLLAADRSTTNH